jgi:hypothetical protein
MCRSRAPPGGQSEIRSVRVIDESVSVKIHRGREKGSDVERIDAAVGVAIG